MSSFIKVMLEWLYSFINDDSQEEVDRSRRSSSSYIADVYNENSVVFDSENEFREFSEE